MVKRYIISILEKLLNYLQDKPINLEQSLELEYLAKKAIESYNEYDRVIHTKYGHGYINYIIVNPIYLEIRFDKRPKVNFNGIEILSLTKV